MSVVVTVYNGQRYLAETLQSVCSQSYTPMEVIVVDDGSTDGSAGIIQSFKGARYMYQPNQGVAIARNTGIRECSGEFIAFIDQDDLWHPQKLAVQIKCLQSDSRLGYVLVYEMLFLEEGAPRSVRGKQKLLNSPHPSYTPSALVARKDVFKTVGVFDPQYRISDDADWFFRAKTASIPMEVHPEMLLKRRIHAGNISAHAATVHKELLSIVRASLNRKRQQ